MKNIIIFPLLLFVFNVWGQTKPVKIVFDVTSKDEAVHKTAIRHVQLMSAAYPDSEFEVVVYGDALSMVLKNNSSVSEDIIKLEGQKNVSILVCEGSMKRHGVDMSQLLPAVGTTPDGILEIVNKQSEGWGYIKEVK